jgi:HD-GYP domain-containing protein (c-di-GMP phosphodiesterase class II)
MSAGAERHDCLLVAPPEAVAVAYAIGLPFVAVSTHLPEPPPLNGIVVCLPDTAPILTLPSDWTGVWARPEPPPPGPWVPLPVSAISDTEAFGRALQTADAWRCDRRQFTIKVGKWGETIERAQELAIALTAERDPQRLLTLILSRTREFVPSDAGSLYLVQQDEHGQPCLRFALAQNDSVNAPWQESIVPLKTTSIAGAVAASGHVVNIDDVYALSPTDPFLHDNSFDSRFNYRTRSVVGIPLVTRDGQVLGVLQLINRKRRAGVPLEDPTQATEVTPFRDVDVEMLCSLASLAAVSLETSLLYNEIEQLFEGFVHASITTIEQRDPTTSGHSFRVAEGTIALARRVERLERGPWAGTRFTAEDMRELRYAALLHDFGKVSVPEKILTKPRKLYDEQLRQIEDRFRLAAASHRAAQFEAWLYAALDDPEQIREHLPQLMEELEEHVYELDCMLGFIHAANQPTIIMTGDYSSLDAIRRRRFLDLQGLSQPMLTELEVHALSIGCGTLTPEERKEIETHVTHSYNFLRMIPWTRDLARVPDLAYGHHEKLDGSGYPRGLAGDDISLGVRMMTIADIFDALTAPDRPYKKSMSLNEALHLMEQYAENGEIDASLVQLWIEARAWEDIQTR